jgi:hypothetical protein
MVTNNVFTNIGDTQVFTNNIPVVGLVGISSYTDVTNGEISNAYFQRWFKYTIDGINWSEWELLTNSALQAILPVPQEVFIINFQYIYSGTLDNQVLEFISIQLNCSYAVQPTPNSYSNMPFSKFVQFFDPETISWALNVLDKLYHRGIISAYVTRQDNYNWEDKDFLDFFYVVCYIIAEQVNIGRYLKEIIFDKSLLNDFLLNRGLFLYPERNLADLTALANNFYDEIRQRGTLQISQRKGQSCRIVDGELFRLINNVPQDEFILALLETQKATWNINNFSPLWYGTCGAMNVVKGYERIQGAASRDAYPLINPQYVSLSPSSIVPSLVNNVISIDRLPAGQVAGIGQPVGTVFKGSAGKDIINKAIIIDPTIAYEITFQVAMISGGAVTFGVTGMDFYGNLFDFSSIQDGHDTNLFFENLQLKDNLLFYTVRGIIYGCYDSLIDDSNYPEGGRLLPDQGATSLGVGNNLQFKQIHNRIMPYIVMDNTGYYGGIGLGLDNIYSGIVKESVQTVVEFYDVKIRPLVSNSDRCFVQYSNVLLSWIKNRNKEQNDVQVLMNASEFLLPHNAILINNSLSDESKL